MNDYSLWEENILILYYYAKFSYSSFRVPNYRRQLMMVDMRGMECYHGK